MSRPDAMDRPRPTVTSEARTGVVPAGRDVARITGIAGGGVVRGAAKEITVARLGGVTGTGIKVESVGFISVDGDCSDRGSCDCGTKIFSAKCCQLQNF